MIKRLHDGGQALPINELQYFSKTLSAGVSAFFVLSGFLLSYPFWVAYFENKNFPSFRLYALKRAARIVPGYYVSLTFCFLMSLLLLPNTVNPVSRFLSGLTFTSAFHWQTLFPTEFDGPLWSVGFEVICYFLLPFAMIGMFKTSKERTLKRGIFYWIGVLSVVLIINNLIQVYGQTDSFRKSWDYGLTGGAKVWWPHYNPIGFFGQYIFGIFAAGLTIIIGKRRKDSPGSYCFDLIALTTTVLLFSLLWSMRYQSPFALSFQGQPYYYPLFPLGIGILLTVLPHTNFMGNFFDNRIFKLTALLSFGLYIWHNVILEFIKIFWISEYCHGGMNDFTSWFIVSIIALVISYLVAALSWKFIEKPALNWGHKKAQIIKVRYLRTKYFEAGYQPSVQVKPTKSIIKS